MFVLDAIRAHGEAGRAALVHRGQTLRFAELDARSDAFAAYLLDRFGEGKSPVVLCGHKEPDLLPCLFGALKAGRAYVPVDAVPPGRLARILEEVRPELIVNLGGLPLPQEQAGLGADGLSALLAAPPCRPLSRDTRVSGEDTAYILFTSGSTGVPKGIPITANNLAAFSRGLAPHMAGEAGGVILNQVSYSFDVSGCSLYEGMRRGMTLFTVDNAMVEDMASLMERLGGSGLTTWVSTPSFAELCVRSKAFTAELLPHLTQFLFCGEVLTHKLCDTLAARFPGVTILNTYGPTEATVLVTAAAVTGEMRRSERSIPIGRPIEGVELRLVGEGGDLVPGDDSPGELVILGNSVGPGYLGRPDLTAQSFFTDAATGKRGYRTGDICTRRGGLYYYVGRTDNQLKLSGHRIELEDIERNLAKLPNIARAALVPVTEEGVARYLVGFLLLEGEDGLTPLARAMRVKRQAAALLPAYMIPRRLIAVDAFPLNSSGKIDRQALLRRLEKTP